MQHLIFVSAFDFKNLRKKEHIKIRATTQKNFKCFLKDPSLSNLLVISLCVLKNPIYCLNCIRAFLRYKEMYQFEKKIVRSSLFFFSFL